MFLTTLAIEEAIGHILRHNIADAQGHKAFAKGRRLRAEDLPRLRTLDIEQVRVAVLEAGDVHEDEAARRLGDAVCGANVIAGAPAASRVNLLAATDGIVAVNTYALDRINDIDGLTIATLPHHALVRARKRVATIKIIPFAVPEADLAQAEAIAHDHGQVLAVRPLRRHDVGVILVGSPAARERIERGVYPAIEGRVTDLGSHVLGVRYVTSDEHAVADAIRDLQHSGVRLLIIAGETSIMDRDDVTPSGIRDAGGRIEHYGAPVEPGNLLLLAYIDRPNGALPIIGAPGCVRSRSVNIVDLLLPRLLAGERVSRRDIVALGHGGLLE
jgi:molybdopterin biosynthesis enzyme